MTEEPMGGSQPQDEDTSSGTSRDDGTAVAVADVPATSEQSNGADEAAAAASETAEGDAVPASHQMTNGGAPAADLSAGSPDPVEVPSSDGAGTAEDRPDDATLQSGSAFGTNADAPAATEPGSGAGAADAATLADDASNVDSEADAADAADAPATDASATGVDASASSDFAVPDVPADEADAAPPAADEPMDEPSGEAVAAPAAPAVDTRPEPTTMEELLGEQSGEIKSFKHGDVVEGQVVRIDKDEILVDIGAKSEGVVSNRELYGRNAESQPQLSIGDTVLVYVLQPESEQGHVVLSLRRAGLERKWRAMQEQFEAGVIIEAPVIDHNKGGLIVDCGIRGFVPISQIVDFPRRPQNDQPRDAAQEIAEKLQPFVGRKLRLKILEVNRKANRLILSEKVALYEERREKRDELFSSLKVSQKVTGTVRSIAPFGVFIDLGGIDGLVHKSELSWNKVNNPEAGYKVGEEVEAEVIDINHERGRISLSIRRLQPDPWHSTVADFNTGDVIDGTVTKIVNFGAFVRVRDGLEGLIHISELSHQRVAHPADVVHEGQRLKLKIISLDSERHRLGLSLKQAEEPPARPEPQPGQPQQSFPQPQPGRERRPRPERSFDASQAVQEPEGGIDNTLAAAFAQVRQQMEQTEQARSGAADDADAADTADALQATDDGSGGAGEAGIARTVDDSTGDDVAQALNSVSVEEDVPSGGVDLAPAMLVGVAESGSGAQSGTEQPAAEASVDAPAAADAEPTEGADATALDLPASGSEPVAAVESADETTTESADADAGAADADAGSTEPTGDVGDALTEAQVADAASGEVPSETAEDIGAGAGDPGGAGIPGDQDAPIATDPDEGTAGIPGDQDAPEAGEAEAGAAGRPGPQDETA